MPDDTRPCPSCGAQVSLEVDRCDLCGTVVEKPDAVQDSDDNAPESTDENPQEGAAPDSDRSDETSASTVFCNQCGWENPPGAQYCSQCGEELQDLPATASPAGTRPVAADLPSGSAPSSEDATESVPQQAPNEDSQDGMGRQIVLLVGGAIVLVVGLFFATQWSTQYEWAEESSSGTASTQAGGNGGVASGGGGGSGPMQTGASGGSAELPDLQTILDQTGEAPAGAMAEQIDSLEARIEQRSGAQKQQARADLVNLLIGAGQPGRAAVLQAEIAESTGTIDAQRRAADLLYRWMQRLQGEGQRQQVLQVARHAAQAYKTVADQRPEDLDARTRMGEAYLLTNRPMRGIKAINGVLDEDSTFVPARFQKGLALLQINRLDQAADEFERVQSFAEEGSPFARQAEQALQVIEKQRQRSAGGSSANTGPAGSN